MDKKYHDFMLYYFTQLISLISKFKNVILCNSIVNKLPGSL